MQYATSPHAAMYHGAARRAMRAAHAARRPATGGRARRQAPARRTTWQRARLREAGLAALALGRGSAYGAGPPRAHAGHGAARQPGRPHWCVWWHQRDGGYVCATAARRAYWLRMLWQYAGRGRAWPVASR